MRLFVSLSIHKKNEKFKKSNKMSNELTNYANQYNDEKIEILFEQN